MATGDQTAHDKFIQQFMQQPLATPAEAEAAWLDNQASTPDTSGTVAWGNQVVPTAEQVQGKGGFQVVKNTPPDWASTKQTTPKWAQGKITPVTKTGDEAVGWLDDIQWENPSEYATVKAKLIAAGLIAADATAIDISNAWAKIVDHAVGFFKRDPNTTWTPLAILDMYAADKAGAVSGGPTTTRYVTKSSAKDIQARYQSIAQQMIGQSPSVSEAPVGAVNAAEAANPSLVTQTPDASGGGTQSTTGGLSQMAVDQILQDRAKQNVNYGAYQAATTYYDALKQILGPAVATGSNG
jgi:hypothetical protein